VWAFVWNYRDGRAHERVLVAGDRLHVQRQPVKGGADHWVVHPTWARVASEEDAVQIRAGGRTVSVAAFLSPDEREDFARALSEALVKARTERFGGKAL